MLKEASILGYESPRAAVVIAGTENSRRKSGATRRKAASAVLPGGRSVRGVRCLSNATGCIRVPQSAVSVTIHAMLSPNEGKRACPQPKGEYKLLRAAVSTQVYMTPAGTDVAI